MGQSTQTNITYIGYISVYDKPKKKLGRPKGKSKYTDEEEKKERSRMRSKRYYDENIEKERGRKRLYYHAKQILFNHCIFYFFIFIF